MSKAVIDGSPSFEYFANVSMILAILFFFHPSPMKKNVLNSNLACALIHLSANEEACLLKLFIIVYGI